MAEKVTVVRVSGETSVKTASEEAVSGVVDLIIDIIYYHCSFNKRSTIYIENLDTSWWGIPLISKNKYIMNLINIHNILRLCITRTS